MSRSELGIEFAPYEEVVPGIEMVRPRPAGGTSAGGRAKTARPSDPSLFEKPSASVIEFPGPQEAPSVSWTRIDLWANMREGAAGERDDDITALNRMQESLGRLDDETRLVRLLIAMWNRCDENAWDQLMTAVRRISDREHPLPDLLADTVYRKSHGAKPVADSQSGRMGESERVPPAMTPASHATVVRKQATWLIALDGWLLGMVGGELESYARGELARLRNLVVDSEEPGKPFTDLEREFLTDELALKAGEWSLSLRRAGRPEQRWLVGCLHRTLRANLGWMQATKIALRSDAAPRRGLDELLAPFRQAM